MKKLPSRPSNACRYYLLIFIANLALSVHAQRFGIDAYGIGFLNPPQSVGFGALCVLPDGAVAVADRVGLPTITMIEPDGRVRWSIGAPGTGTITDIRPSNDGQDIIVLTSSLLLGGPSRRGAGLWKLSATTGAVRWGGVLEGSPIADGEGLQVVAPANGGYLLLGASPAILLKVDEQGVLIWQARTDLSSKSVTSTALPTARNLLREANGDHWLFQNSPDGAHLVRLQADSTVVQSNTYQLAGGIGAGQYDFITLALMADGGRTLAGNLLADDGTNRPFVARLSADGAVRWGRVFQLGGGLRYAIQGIASLADGSLLMGGLYFEANNSRAFLARIDPAGNPVWLRAYNPGDTRTEVVSMAASPTGGYVATGHFVRRAAGSGQLIGQSMLLRTDREGFAGDCCARAVPITASPLTVVRKELTVRPQSPPNIRISAFNFVSTTVTTVRVPTPCKPINLDFTIGQKEICPTECLEVSFPSPSPNVQYVWKFPGAQPDTFAGAQPGRVCYGTSNGKYPVTLSADEGCRIRIDSIEVDTRENEEPNVFTPNGDNVNDVFSPVLFCPVANAYSLEIFNRWGQLIFQSEDAKTGWDGTVDGQEAPSEVYIWRTKYQAWFNNELKDYDRRGNVSLLR